MSQTIIIESMADVPGVRVPKDQRCPVCDLRMEAGTWAVEVKGEFACSVDCHNTLATRQPELEHALVDSVLMTLESAIQKKERDREYYQDLADSADLDHDELTELRDRYQDHMITLKELQEGIDRHGR